jgi:dihydrofolate reductase
MGWIAIAAMSLNRAIGMGNRIPWHLPEDFQWFKRMTTGHTLVMGRKTFESIGRPLPNRRTLILSRSAFNHPGTTTISKLSEINAPPGQKIFICGGAEIYRIALPYCGDLYLTLVQREVAGDAFFPPFETDFVQREICLEKPEFIISHWVRREASPPLPIVSC